MRRVWYDARGTRKSDSRKRWFGKKPPTATTRSIFLLRGQYEFPGDVVRVRALVSTTTARGFDHGRDDIKKSDAEGAGTDCRKTRRRLMRPPVDIE